MLLPKINQKVEFKVLHGPYASAFSTYVEDVDDRTIVVVRPMMGGQPVPLTVGDPVRLEYAVENTARLAFPTRINGLDVRVLPVVLLAHPNAKTVERFQQRDFVRLEAVLNLSYTVRFVPGRAAPPTGTAFSRTRDISGNGAQILCPAYYPSGTQLDMSLNVGEYLVRVVGQVIRQFQPPGTREVWTGVRFVAIDERDRDVIIRYIFNEQRERRRKGFL
ncbi:MAG TPA: flagellar brake protein [Symbiobacteriaceae bacterium]